MVLATLNHGLVPEERHDLFPAPIHIGKYVRIGANAAALTCVTIGENAVIAAGAVVAKDVSANTVVAGVPAKVIRRFEKDKGAYGRNRNVDFVLPFPCF